MIEHMPTKDVQQVEALPYPIVNNSRFRLMTYGASPKYTHYLFQFPAKFHAPVIKWVLRYLVPKSGLVLDPYNGSGTLQVEALAGGYNSIGLDIDLIATFIAKTKTTLLSPKSLTDALQIIMDKVAPCRRSTAEYELRMSEDLTGDEFDNAKCGLEIPAIPSIEHWFRRYVIIDLVHLREVIEQSNITSELQAFFLAVFAAIIRRCSNADPVPVSGLEYTKEMKRRDKEGRYIDPFTLFEQRAEREIAGMTELWNVSANSHKNWAIVHHGNALNLVDELDKIRNQYDVEREIDAVITSPPYCSAVDYHTRHKLEAYWLRLVENQEEYLRWYHRYIGRRRIRVADRNGYALFGINELDDLISNLRDERQNRAAALNNYFISLENSFKEIGQVLRPGGTFVIFIGNSRTHDYEIDTHSFARKLASRYFNFESEFSYELRNRYMWYTRHNGADIDTEWVMIFSKPA